MAFLSRPETKAHRPGYFVPRWRAGTPYQDSWDVDRAVKDGLQKVTWVFRAVDAICTAWIKLPFQFRVDDAVDGAPVETHPLYRVLNREANPQEDSAVFRYRLMASYLLSRRGVFVEVVRTNGGDVESLWILPTPYTHPVPGNNGIAAFEVRTPGMDAPDRLRPNQVLWIRKPHPIDPFAALTPLESVGLAADVDWYARLYNRNFLRNDGRPGGVLAISEDMDEDDVEELRRRFVGGPDNAGRVTVITGAGSGSSFVDTAVTPRDAQYVQARAASKEEILIGFGTPESILGNASGRCVDDRTECLTLRGWLRGVEVTTDDTILSMDPFTGCLRWSPVREVYRNETYDGPMYRLKHAHIDALVTPGHRWATTDGRLVPVEALRESDRIRMMGEPEAGAAEVEFSSAFVEAVGWAVTEGHYCPNETTLRARPNRTAPYIRIRQKDGPFIDRIRACLKESGATFSEYYEERGMWMFNVRGEVAAAIQAVAPNRVLSMPFLAALTADQRELLFQTMVDGDGTRPRNTASIVYSQKSREAAESFVTLATLTGRSTSMREKYWAGNGDWPANTKYRVIVRDRKVLTTQRGMRTREHYAGAVWCPRTDYGTFVARRDGFVFVTGNTWDNADVETAVFWEWTMMGHLELFARQFDRLEPNERLHAGWDLTGVSVLQRETRDRERHHLAEFAAGLETVNGYRRKTGQEPFPDPAADLTYMPNGLVAVATDSEDVLDARDALAPPGEVTEPAAAGNGQVSAGKALAPMGAHESSEWEAEEAKSRDVRLRRWERHVTVSMRAFFARQERIVLEKLEGPKALRGTRHYAGTQHRGTKAIDPAVVFDLNRWDDLLADEARTWIEAIWEEWGQDAIDQMARVGMTRPPDAKAVEPKPITPKFDVQDPVIQQNILGQINRLKNVNLTTYRDIQRELARGEALGEGIPDLKKRVQHVLTGAKGYRAERIARTEVLGAANAGAWHGGLASEAKAKKWLSAVDSRTRADHLSVEGGRWIPVTREFQVGASKMMYPHAAGAPAGQTVNCFPADTRVIAPGLERAYRRWYDGPMIVVRTASGHELTGTPNHPVLTPFGWTALGDLQPGDSLVRRVRGEEMRLGDPDVKGPPPRIAQIFDAAAAIRGSKRVIGLEVDFHGDGRHGEVEIVGADGLLGLALDPALPEPIRHDALAVADPVREILEDAGAGYAGLECVALAAPGGVSGVHDALTHLRREGGPPEGVGRALRPQGDAAFLKSPEDDGPGAAVMTRERVRRLALNVAGDEIVHIEVKTFHGWVFNLQTVDGWYIANGFLSHNCRCTVIFRENLPVEAVAPELEDIDPATLSWRERIDHYKAKLPQERGQWADDAQYWDLRLGPGERSLAHEKLIRDIGKEIVEEAEDRFGLAVENLREEMLRLRKQANDLQRDLDRIIQEPGEGFGEFWERRMTVRTPLKEAKEAVKATQLQIAETRAKVYREVLNEVREMGPGKIPKGETALNYWLGSPGAKATMEKAVQWLPRDWIARSNEAGSVSITKLVKGGRTLGWHRDLGGGNSMIALGKIQSKAAGSTPLHELVHRMEMVMPEIKRLEHAFYFRRAGTLEKGLEALDTTTGYGSDVRSDKFFDAYVGRDYGATKDSHYEVLTRGVEFFEPRSDSMTDNYLPDLDHRYFILGLMGAI